MRLFVVCVTFAIDVLTLYVYNQSRKEVIYTNERLKKLRKMLDLTQQEFADKIGIKRNTMAQYEIGRNEPIDAVIISICREFNVNEKWLRTGEGDMFISSDDANIEKLERILKGENSLAKNLFKTFIAFDEEDWEALNRMIEKFNSIDAEALTLFDSIPASPEELEKKFPPVKPKNHKNTAG